MLRARRLGPALLALAVASLYPAHEARSDGAASRVVKGPYVTAFTGTTADLRFELGAPGPATVEIVRDHAGDAPRKVQDATVSAVHVVHVTGLEAGKQFDYGITAGGQAVANGSFTTASPDPGAVVRFVAYGDERSDTAAHAGVVRAVVASHPSFLVNTGDMVADGASADDWASFFRIEAPLLRTTPIFAAIGNHELVSDEAATNFSKYFGFPAPSGGPKLYGTTRVGVVRLFFLNSMHDWSSGEERTWLEQALTAADHETGLLWRVAVTHHGPWAAGPHGGNERLLSAHIPELLAAHGVNLMISGHDHIYERGDAGIMKYLVSGGGGAPLYPISSPVPSTTRKAESVYHYVQLAFSPTDLRLVAHRMDGSILERCGFMLGRDWDCDPSPAVVAPAPAAPSASAPSAPAASAPAPAAPSSSRCGVAAVGAPGPAPLGGAAMLVAGALALVRPRRACRRAREGALADPGRRPLRSP